MLDTVQTRAINGFTKTKVIKNGAGQVEREETVTRSADRLLLREVERNFPDYRPETRVHVSGDVNVSGTIQHELAQPRHVLETLAITLQYNPVYQHLAPALLPGVQQALAELKAEESAVVEGEVRQV